MECDVCGKKIPNDALVCENCGTTVESMLEQQEFEKQLKAHKKSNTPAMTVMQYLYMQIVMLIPIAGIVIAILWAFKDNVNQNRQNLARSTLISYAIVIIIFVVVSIILSGFIGEFVVNYFSLFK